jgi:hypothetical protein
VLLHRELYPTDRYQFGEGEEEQEEAVTVVYSWFSRMCESEQHRHPVEFYLKLLSSILDLNNYDMIGSAEVFVLACYPTLRRCSQLLNLFQGCKIRFGLIIE